MRIRRGRGKGDEFEEALFRAYFVAGQNVGDHDTLASLASGIGLPEDEAREVLRSGRFADDVRRDLKTAAQFGINAVPCFVLDRKYAVSGAQDSAVLLQALQRGGAYAAALVAGATDMDAIALSMARLAQGGLEPRVATTAIFVAAASNTVVKAVLAGSIGGLAFGRMVAVGFGAMLAAGGLALAVAWL